MADIKELEVQVAALKADVASLKANAPEDKLSMVVMSGDMDKLLASFIIATGAAAMFEKVVMFFTFWSIPALKDPKKTVSKDTVSKMFELMLPNGAGGAKLSKMNMGGMGKMMIESIMKKHNVMSLEQLMQTAADSGVQIYVCQMSMDLMGYKMEEMIDYPNLKSAGVAKFLAEAGTSKSSLFI
jgi:peroxiredoxin family protein